MHQRNKSYMSLALLVGFIAFLVYLPALRNSFAIDWDDQKMVFNPATRSFDLNLLKWTFSAEANDTFGPLYVLSFALDYAIWGLNPLGYHLTNIILHSINAFLLFVLLIRIGECGVKNIKSDKPNLLRAGSFIAVLLFAVHPLNVESVTWISARNGPLSAMFFLGSIYNYLNYATGRRKADLFKSLILFALATLSKPTTATLPGILLIIDYALLKRLSFKKRDIKEIKGVLLEKIPFFLIGIFSVGATAWIRQSAGFVTDVEPLPFALRIFVAIRALGFYILKVAFPVNLVPIYAYPDKINILDLEYMSAIILLTTISLICFLYRKKSPLYLSVWFYYIIMLIPILISLLAPVSTRRYAEADRYAYLACMGPFFLFGLGLSRYIELSSKKVRYAIISSLIVLFGFFAIRTIDQISIWHDPISLWSHQIGVSPSTYEAYTNRGTAYYNDGQYRLALQDYNKAVEHGPNYSISYYNRGNAYSAMQETDKAIKDFTKAIELNPRNANVFSNRGNAFNSVGDFQRAIEDQTTAIGINPKNADFYFNRGLAHTGLGEFKQAISDYSKAIELNPYDADAYLYRGEALERTGKHLEAEIDYKKADELGLKR